MEHASIIKFNKHRSIILNHKQDKIAWLHVSDYHIKPDEYHKPIQNFRALKKDIEEIMKNEGIMAFDFIIITGDLAYYGNKNDYEDVKKFLDDLLKITKTPKKDLYVVPGNHDIIRKETKKFMALGVFSMIFVAKKASLFSSQDRNFSTIYFILLLLEKSFSLLLRGFTRKHFLVKFSTKSLILLTWNFSKTPI